MSLTGFSAFRTEFVHSYQPQLYQFYIEFYKNEIGELPFYDNYTFRKKIDDFMDKQETKTRIVTHRFRKHLASSLFCQQKSISMHPAHLDRKAVVWDSSRNLRVGSSSLTISSLLVGLVKSNRL